MHSQLLLDGADSHRASSARTFKGGVAIGAGAGLLVGAIVALCLFPPALHDASEAGASNLIASPSVLNSRFSAATKPQRDMRVMSTNPDAPIKLGINGFGRIGRQVARIAMDRDDFVIKHINS